MGYQPFSSTLRGDRMKTNVSTKLSSRAVLGVLFAWTVCSWLHLASAAEAEPAQARPEAAGRDAKVIKLFDGKSLEGWQVLDKIDFEKHGEVSVKDGELILKQGQPMTGIRWKGEFPKLDYEVTLEARRIDGFDFFCGMTFPVGKSHCSLVLGGWGGSLTGLSCLDGFDASENETTGSMDFKQNRWYKIRVRVTEKKIQAWVDDDQIVDVEHKDRKISLRWEMDPMPPFGIATYATTGGVRNLVVTRL
jgi:hypothetical protein